VVQANGIEDHSFVKEMDYQEVLNSQEIFGDELAMFAKKELQKEVGRLTTGLPDPYDLLIFGPPGYIIICSVADPDPTYHLDADSDFYLMRIWIRLFTRIRILVSNKGSNPLKSAQICSYSIHFDLSSAN
jgi:hypothetical protein